MKLDLPKLPELRAGMFGRVSVRTGDERAGDESVVVDGAPQLVDAQPVEVLP